MSALRLTRRDSFGIVGKRFREGVIRAQRDLSTSWSGVSRKDLANLKE